MCDYKDDIKALLEHQIDSCYEIADIMYGVDGKNEVFKYEEKLKGIINEIYKQD